MHGAEEKGLIKALHFPFQLLPRAKGKMTASRVIVSLPYPGGSRDQQDPRGAGTGWGAPGSTPGPSSQRGLRNVGTAHLL